MRNHATLRSGILVLFLAVIAAGCQKTGVNAANENSNKESVTVGSLPVWDADFLVDAEKWESRQRGLTQAALNRARGADVQSYAQMVMDDHSRTQQQLADLMKKKGVSRPGLATEEELEGSHRLDSVSGTDAFDHEYLSVMAADTEQTLRRFTAAAETADDREVRAYASAVLPVIQKEQRQSADLEQKLAKPRSQ
jgi:putative membrane protein